MPSGLQDGVRSKLQVDGKLGECLAVDDHDVQPSGEPGSETGAMIEAMPRPRGAAHTGAPVPRAIPLTSRELGALASWRPGSGGRGAARQMTCRPPVAEVGSEPCGDLANLRRRARGDAAAQGAPEVAHRIRLSWRRARPRWA